MELIASKQQTESESGAGSFLLRGRPRRVQIEPDGEPPVTCKGDAVEAGPPAGDGGRCRSRDDGCTCVSPQRGGLIYTSMAPQRRGRCKIARAGSLLGLLVASDGKRNVSICGGCADRSVGGSRSSWWRCFDLGTFCCLTLSRGAPLPHRN